MWFPDGFQCSAEFKVLQNEEDEEAEKTAPNSTPPNVHSRSVKPLTCDHLRFPLEMLGWLLFL